MQRILFIIFYATWILLHNVYGTITGRKGTQFSTAEFEEKILMPGVHPSVEDEYFCIGKKLKNYDQYITSFEALANSTSVHHLLLYGCKTPYSKSGGWWKCGAICGEGGPSILYAWAKNAPPVQMPPNVGFHVSGKTPVSYIVMQIHYKHPIDKSKPADKSGVKLVMTTKSQKFLAGIYIMMRYLFTIPAHSSGVHSDVSCRYSGNSKLYPFAFRVHAHSLGRVISAYQYNDTGWHKLGKGNPQWPQAFYPINENLVIKPGDRLVARCTFDARNRKADTHIGSTHNDEMCNFYLMYYTPATVGSSYFQCGGDNIPRLSDKLPDESDSPLPPNPLLENWATGILSSGRPASHSNAENYDILYDYYDMDKPKYDYYYDTPNFYPYPSYRKPLIPNVQRKPSIKQPFMQRPHHDNMVDHGSVEASRNRVTEKVIPEKVKTVKSVLPQYVENWPKSELKVGQISGVGTDSKGNIHIFHRADRIWDLNSFNNDHVLYEKIPIKDTTILVLDPEGNPIRSWGSNMFYMPHGLHIDKDDNVWITDVGSHQVFKFPPNSATPSLILGTKLIPGGDTKHFCKPANVVTVSTGEFFVADGYCNSRIIKYSADGKILAQWGETAEIKAPVDSYGYPPPNSFLVPHSLAVNEDKKYIYIADREHGRMTTFDFEGNFIFQTHPKEFGGILYAITYDKSAKLIYAINGPSVYKKIAVRGFTLNPLTGDLLDTWSAPQGFSQPHDINVNKQGTSLYISEIGPNVIHKFHLENSNVTLLSHEHHTQQHNHVRQTYDTVKRPLNSFRDHPKQQSHSDTSSKSRPLDDSNGTRKGKQYEEIKFLKSLLSNDSKSHYKSLLDTLANSIDAEDFKRTYDEIMKELFGESKSQTAEIPVSEINNIVNASNETKMHIKIKKLLMMLNGTEEEVEDDMTSPGTDINVVTHPLDKQHSTQTSDFIISTVPNIMKSEIQDDDMKASIIIGSLLLVPVIIIVLVVVILRLKRSGKISYIDAAASFGKINKNRRNFNIGQIFNRHKGFDRLSQEDGELDHLNSDSEVEDYSTTEQKA